METISLIYKFLSCPLIDVETKLRDLGHSSNDITDYKTIHRNQKIFCEEYNIPLLSLTPFTTKYVDITSLISTNLNIWQVRERYISFEYGTIFWEITFQAKLNQIPSDIRSGYLLIEGKNVLSNAIHRKKLMCKKERLCISCRQSKTYFELELIMTDNAVFFKNFNQIRSALKTAEPFWLNSHQWIISGHSQLLYNPNFEEIAHNSIINSIGYATMLIKTIRYSGNELLTRRIKPLPPYDTIDDDTTELIQDFIAAFFFRYVFTHPDFILNKNDIRLHIPALILKSLINVYPFYGKDELWDPSVSSNTNKIPPALLVIVRLYSRIRVVPHPVLQKWCKLLNPFNYFLPPEEDYYRNTLSEDEQKICIVLAKELVNSTHTNQKLNLQNQARLVPHSVSSITKMIGYSGGRANRKVEEKLDDLHEKGLIVRSTPEELKISRGKADFLYYLNPQTPFTQYWIELAKLSTGEIDIFLNDIYS